MSSKYKMIKEAPKDSFRVIGMGAPAGRFDAGRIRNDAQGLGAALNPTIEDLRYRANCPLLTMPTVIEVGWLLNGPQTADNIDVSFGSEIDPFHSGKSPNITGVVETNLAMPGETQTHMIVCGIGWHLEPEPFCCTIDGNAWTVPTVGTTQPLSPDVFTVNDITNGALGPVGVGDVQMAQLEWGWWANYAAWCMVQAYNLRWMVGTNCNILLDSLRNTAYMPPASQTGSASDSEVDVPFLVRRTNDFYQQFLDAQQVFLKTNAIRISSTGVQGVGAGNLGSFRPSRDHERQAATYGGIGLSGLLQGNTEFRPLSMPYIIKAGVPVGLKAEEVDTTLGDTMRRYLAADMGFGGVVPPAFTDESEIIAGPSPVLNAGVSFLERTLDGNNVSQQLNSQRVQFKGGGFNIKVKIKGFEITEDLYNLMANNPDIRDAICSECGIRFAQQGASS